MLKRVLFFATCILFITGCGKKVNSIASIDVNNYNNEIAKFISLSSGVTESPLISKGDFLKVSEVYEENKEHLEEDGVNVSLLLKPFFDELKTTILLKYNNKYYRYEYYQYGEDYADPSVELPRLTQEERDKTTEIYKKIEYTWREFAEIADIDDAMLEKIYGLCEEYRALSDLQKDMVSNSGSLAYLVETFGGSLETNFNLEFWLWNIKKARGEEVDAYNGPTDEELGIVQGRQMFGEISEKKSNTNTPAETTDIDIKVPEYDIESASFDDLETRLEIPHDFYDCVVDCGTQAENYTDELKLYEHIV